METYIGRSKGVNPFWIFAFGFGIGKFSGEQRTVSEQLEQLQNADG
ncbi:MAG: hypothetical protein ABSF71_24440 [Terriglobia bacterium]|jgi:hypothetical protein